MSNPLNKVTLVPEELSLATELKTEAETLALQKQVLEMQSSENKIPLVITESLKSRANIIEQILQMIYIKSLGRTVS